MQVAIHAIGDKANIDVLTLYKDAQGNNTSLPTSRRHRIEHAQHLSGPDAIIAFSQQQITAVVNPLHLLSDMHIMLDRLGEKRSDADHAFAYKAMLQVGLSCKHLSSKKRSASHIISCDTTHVYVVKMYPNMPYVDRYSKGSLDFMSNYAPLDALLPAVTPVTDCLCSMPA